MAKWKEVPSVPSRYWTYNPTAKQMETLLDAVFYKVIGRVPVPIYKENVK